VTDGAPLLVLGASEEQVPIYREASRRGLATIAVDMRADRPGVALADEFLHISTADHDAIGAALAGRRLAGVVSTASDACLGSWWRLAERFRTPWRYPPAAAAVSMDKAAFHTVAAEVGIDTYHWLCSDRPAELVADARLLRFPLVVKPTDAGGGRGIRRVDVAADLADAVCHAAAHSAGGRVVVEEFLVGRNLTVNVFLLGGEVVLSAVTEQLLLPGRGLLIGGHLAPARLTPATERALVSDAARLCAAFDLTDGPANFDVVLGEDGRRYVVEVGARMSGNGYPELMRAATGVDCTAALVDLVTGVPVRLTDSHPRRPARLQVLASPLDVPGELRGVAGLAEVAATPGVAAVDVFAAPGDLVRPHTESGHKLGWLVVTADRAEQLPAVLRRARRRLRITVAPTVTPTVTPTPAPAVSA
jgi:biotin carboxylase